MLLCEPLNHDTHHSVGVYNAQCLIKPFVVPNVVPSLFHSVSPMTSMWKQRRSSSTTATFVTWYMHSILRSQRNCAPVNLLDKSIVAPVSCEEAVSPSAGAAERLCFRSRSCTFRGLTAESTIRRLPNLTRYASDNVRRK